MKVSCSCLSYGRTALLEEAVESFLRQDYVDKELVILNTFTKQKLVFNHPQVKVVNHPTRPATIGETRNLCIERCSGELVLTYDDDDIFLPGYISWLVKNLGGMDWVKQGSKFSIRGNKVLQLAGQANNQFMFRKSAWRAVGGYPKMDSGEDCEFHKLLKNRCVGKTVTCAPADTGFCYRFHAGPYNLSSCGRNAPGRETGLQRCHRKLVQRGVKSGRITLNPHWRYDYLAMTRRWLKVNGYAI